MLLYHKFFALDYNIKAGYSAVHVVLLAKLAKNQIPSEISDWILPTNRGIRHGRINCHLAALSPHEIQIRITIFQV